MIALAGTWLYERKMIVVAYLLLWLCAMPAGCTLLLLIYTKDGFWLGADSARSDQKVRTGTVCKVHETRYGLLLKGGDAVGTSYNGAQYATDNVVLSVLRASSTPEEFKALLRARFKSDIEAELAFDLKDPRVTPENLKLLQMDTPIPSELIPILVRQAFLFNAGLSSGKGEALVVKPQSDLISHNFSQIGAKYRYWAPSVLGWHPIADLESAVHVVDTGVTFTVPDSVRLLVGAVNYSREDAWVQSHPKKAMSEMLEIGNRDDPQHVGPPYVILHVVNHPGDRRYNIKWLSKGVCPSWAGTSGD